MKKIIFAMLLALPMTTFAQKIGHVDVDAVAQGMAEVTALQTEIQNLQKQFDDELKRKEADIQAKNDAYEKEKATLSETLRTYREQDIQKADPGIPSVWRDQRTGTAENLSNQDG